MYFPSLRDLLKGFFSQLMRWQREIEGCKINDVYFLYSPERFYIYIVKFVNINTGAEIMMLASSWCFPEGCYAVAKV